MGIGLTRRGPGLGFSVHFLLPRQQLLTKPADRSRLLLRRIIAFADVLADVEQQQPHVAVDQARPLLFDLSSDIGERTDVIRQHVDVATRLQAALIAWQADVDGEAKAHAVPVGR